MSDQDKETIEWLNENFAAKAEEGQTTLMCDGCGKEFEEGNRPDGLPGGVNFQTDNGVMVTVCTDCMIRLGRMNNHAKFEFYNKLRQKKPDLEFVDLYEEDLDED